MAESLSEAAQEAAKGIGQVVVHYTSAPSGGTLSITISSISARAVRDVCIAAGVTTFSLGAIYVLYKSLKKQTEIRDAVSRAVGGERDDQKTGDIKPGSLHVLLHCFTDQRLLEVLEDYESGRMKDRLEREFSDIGIEVEGLKVEIDNIEEIMKRKDQM